MLVEAANEVLESGGSLRQMRFYGQEVNLTTAAIARMNLFLHDIEDVVIRRGDTLRDPKFLDERGRLQRFDVVITNPPFSLKNWGAEVWTHDPWGRAACGVPPASNGDFAWVQHMLASMTPGTGRVGVVMPHGVLFRGGAEGAIRECLLRADRLDAVVGLAPNLFYSTTIPACLLIFRATKPPERRGHVLFVDGSKRFAKGRNQNSVAARRRRGARRGISLGRRPRRRGRCRGPTRAASRDRGQRLGPQHRPVHQGCGRRGRRRRDGGFATLIEAQAVSQRSSVLRSGWLRPDMRMWWTLTTRVGHACKLADTFHGSLCVGAGPYPVPGSNSLDGVWTDGTHRSAVCRDGGH